MAIMLAFYNNHMNFYSNYAEMLARWAHVTFEEFMLNWPPRPSIVLAVPLVAKIIQLGYLAFTRGHVDEKEKAKKRGRR